LISSFEFLRDGIIAFHCLFLLISLTSRMTGGVEPQSEAARLYTVRVDAIVGILFLGFYSSRCFSISSLM
jgi:hypothetical protein